jgi:anti-sigma B factor antagonist
MGLTVRLKQSTTSIITLLPAGKIDSDTSEILDREIARALTEPVKTLVIDMAGVSFITSAGIGVIIKAKVSTVRKNAEFAMIHLQPQVKQVFEIIRLLPTMNVFESVEELDKYLGIIQRRISEGDSEF